MRYLTLEAKIRDKAVFRASKKLRRFQIRLENMLYDLGITEVSIFVIGILNNGLEEELIKIEIDKIERSLIK